MHQKLTLLLGVLFIASACRGDLVHHYQFDTDASDSIGGAHGTLINGADVSGGRLVLDGVNDYVQFGQKLVPTTGNYTVALLARQSAAQTTFAELISQGFSGGPGFYIGHDDLAAKNIRVSDSWTNTAVPFPGDGLWHHYAVVVDAGAPATRLYVDGLLAATLPMAVATTSAGNNTRLGRQFDPGLEFFFGMLDDVRVYDHVLTDDQVRQLAVPEPFEATLVSWLLIALGLPRSCRLLRRKAMP